LGAPLIIDTMVTDDDEDNYGFNDDDYDYGFWGSFRWKEYHWVNNLGLILKLGSTSNNYLTN
jgi:hypothetical protein